MGHELLAAAHAMSEWIIDIRREIHRYPELGFDCVNTSALVQKVLDALEIYYYKDKTYAQTGVVGRIGSGNAPCVALRADMDAIPVQELYIWDHQSTRDNISHACGHDAHVAMLLGAAKLLQERYKRKEFEGTVLLIFQPAEETLAGAKAMVEDGALKNAEAIFGLHVTNASPAGYWGSKAGIVMAGSQKFSAQINGKGGHGGIPQEAIDPIVASSFVIASLQPIISRETDPNDSQVITIGYINGGEAYNVIPDFATIGGSFRHFEKDETVLEVRKQRIFDVIENGAKVYRCTVDPLEWDPMYAPPLVNSQDTFEFAKGAVMEVLQDESKVVTILEPATASEDFPFYLKKVPGAFAFVGCQGKFPEDGIVYSNHSPKFVIDESCLAYGAAMYANLAIKYIVDKPTFVSPKSEMVFTSNTLRRIDYAP